MTPDGANWAAAYLGLAVQIGYGLLAFSFLFGLLRAAQGPALSDRLVALKHVWLASIGFLALHILQTGLWRVLDLALVLALLGGMVPLAAAWARRRRARLEMRPASFAEGEPHVHGD